VLQTRRAVPVALLAEIFPTRAAIPGVGTSYYLAGIVGGATPPLVSTPLTTFGSLSIGIPSPQLAIALHRRRTSCTCRSCRKIRAARWRGLCASRSPAPPGTLPAGRRRRAASCRRASAPSRQPSSSPRRDPPRNGWPGRRRWRGTQQSHHERRRHPLRQPAHGAQPPTVHYPVEGEPAIRSQCATDSATRTDQLRSAFRTGQY
jgi:hypothetical protein